MKNLPVGIIGCGDIARAHKKAYRTSGRSVVAVTDVNREAAEALIADLPEAKVSEDYRELIDSGLVKAVSICTPPSSHEEIAVYALQKGISVLSEKPLAHTLESARRIAETVEVSSGILMTAFRHRFIKSVIKMKELIAQIGPIVMFHNIFCGPGFNMGEKWFSKPAISGGGALIDTAAHSIDLFRFLVGEIVDQKALLSTRLENVCVEDTAALAVRSEGGAVGSILCSWIAGRGAASIEIFGENGRIFFDYSKPDRVQIMRRGEPEWEDHSVEVSSGFEEQVAHFCGAVEGEWGLSCGVREGLRVQEVIDAVYSK